MNRKGKGLKDKKRKVVQNLQTIIMRTIEAPPLLLNRSKQVKIGKSQFQLHIIGKIWN